MYAVKAGIAFWICLIVGIVLGALFGNVEIGGGIGLGIGCTIVALFRKKRW